MNIPPDKPYYYEDVLFGDAVWIGEDVDPERVFMALAEVGVFPVHEHGGYLMFDDEQTGEALAMIDKAVAICEART